jgi:hypothetical protein
MLLALVYGMFALRWWAFLIVVPGILIAILVQAWPSKRPLSILHTGPEEPAKKPRDNPR